MINQEYNIIRKLKNNIVKQGKKAINCYNQDTTQV